MKKKKKNVSGEQKGGGDGVFDLLSLSNCMQPFVYFWTYSVIIQKGLPKYREKKLNRSVSYAIIDTVLWYIRASVFAFECHIVFVQLNTISIIVPTSYSYVKALYVYILVTCIHIFSRHSRYNRTPLALELVTYFRTRSIYISDVAKLSINSTPEITGVAVSYVIHTHQ